MPTSETDIAALFLAHQARIYGFIGSLVPNRADAEDLLQETGIVLFKRAEDFQPGTNFFTWACEIAHNKVLNHRTRQSRSPLRFGDEFITAIANYQFSQAADDNHRHAALTQCLEKLTPKDRKLVEDCYRGGATIKSVAEQVGRPPNVIYKRLRQIRQLLGDCVRKNLALGGHS